MPGSKSDAITASKLPSLPNALPSAPPASTAKMDPQSAPLPLPGGPLTLPDAGKAPDLSKPDLAKIEPLPAAPPAPPIPNLPPLPGTTSDVPQVQPAEAKQEDKKEITQAVLKHKGQKKHHCSKTATLMRHKNINRNYYRSERLPETIYAKAYDKLNKHLPTAYYESEYDGLVFVTAQRDDINGLRAMLDSGRNMELIDRDGDTPLLVAVKHNAINVTRLLLGRHANYNVTDRSGASPIQIAEQNGNFEMVRAIEAAGATATQ
jgi:hypothetical protein